MGRPAADFPCIVDAAPEAGAAADGDRQPREAATVLLGLPWELLHDGEGFLFQGAKPTRVRRRLPNTRDDLKLPVVAPPIRILLVTAPGGRSLRLYRSSRECAAACRGDGGTRRPRDYPRAEPADAAGLARGARPRSRESEPYHVVHFDGHGVYDRRAGLGGLCFEDPQDTASSRSDGTSTVFTGELGPLLRDYRIPLVFLEACQTARPRRRRNPSPRSC